MTSWLIDKSALVRLAASRDATEWAARIERGLVRITTVTRPGGRVLGQIRTGPEGWAGAAATVVDAGRVPDPGH